jgi:hypothetical protein
MFSRALPVLFLSTLVACSGEAPPPAPVEPAPAPPVEPAPAITATMETKVLSLDAPGGLNGAPEGLNFILPDPKGAQATSGPLSDGSTGFKLTAKNPGDAVVCTQPLRLQPTLAFKSRVRVAEVKPGAQPWMGLNIEMRARDDAGNLVSPPGGRYTLLQNIREPGEFLDLEHNVTLPSGATKAELCFRFVESRGTVEVDSVSAVGVLPEPAEAVAVAQEIPEPTTRFDLDEAGGGGGAPKGADFFIPAGIAGVSTRVGALENSAATGFTLTVSSPGNALACSSLFPVTAGSKVWAQGNVRVRDVKSDARQFAGFTAEVRSYDAANALVSPAGSPFVTVQVWKSSSADFAKFGKEFTVPDKAATSKLCLRFAESTGSADIDWLGVTTESAPTVADGANGNGAGAAAPAP